MRTVVGLYDRFEDAQNAVQDLLKVGFERDQVNFISRDAKGDYTRALKTDTETDAIIEPEDTGDSAVSGAGVGAVLGGLTGLLVGLGALAIPGIGPVIAAGPLITTLAGAGIGAVSGGLIGALVDMGIPEEHSHYYAEGIRRGGTLVTVQTSDQQVDSALTILNRYHPVDIETRAQTWREKNWAKFDEAGQPLDVDSMEYNRSYYQRRQETPIDSGQQQELEFDRRNVPVTGDETRTSPNNPDIDYGDLGDDDIDRHPQERDIPVTGGETSVVPGLQADLMDQKDWIRYEPIFQDHYQKVYFDRGNNFQYYRPAYQFGYIYANNPQYRGRSWSSVEPELREEWTRRAEMTPWDEVKDAVHYAWDSLVH